MSDSKLKAAKQINVELANPRSRTSALPKLKKLLCNQDEIVLSENIVNWLKTLQHIILTDDQNEDAVKNFDTILSQACQVPSISRDISTNLLPGILDELLKVEDMNLPILKAINAVILFYPTSCGKLRPGIMRRVMPLVLSSEDADIRDTALRCWSACAFLGGGGHQRANHCQQWLDQFKESIAAMKSAFKCYLDVKQGNVSPEISKIGLPSSSLPKTEPERSDQLIQRIRVFCRCFQNLMTVDFPRPLPFPVDSLVDILLQVLDVMPSQMGSTTEMVYRASHLSEIHGDVLSVLSTLFKICRRHLCCYASVINNTFSALLDLWKDESPVPGRSRKHHIVRGQVYETITDWLQNCGPTTRFMCGKSISNDSFSNHILDDITPVEGTSTRATKNVSVGLSKRAKRRKLVEATDEMMNGNSSEKITDVTANEYLTASALQVVECTVAIMGHRLSASIVRLFQENIVSLLLRLEKSEEIHPYRKCVRPRLELYRALKSLVLSPSVSVAPPCGMATKIFMSAVSKETSPEIRNFCQDSMLSLNVIVHPRRHALQVDRPLQSNDTKFINEKVTVPEPMNVSPPVSDEDGSDDESCETTVKVSNIVPETNPVSGGDLHRKTAEFGSNGHRPEPEEISCDDTLPQPDESGFENNSSEKASEWVVLKSPVRDDKEIKETCPITQSLIENPKVVEPQLNGAEDIEEVNEMLLDFVDASPDPE